MTKKDSKTKKNSRNSSKREVIDVYTQPIYYPNKLIVCKNISMDKLNKKFMYSDSTPLMAMDGADAVTYCFVINKKTNKTAVLVLIQDSAFTNTDEHYLIGLSAHEALHVAHRILENSGEFLRDDSCESYAYMTEWATKCIYNTMIKK